MKITDIKPYLTMPVEGLAIELNRNEVDRHLVDVDGRVVHEPPYLYEKDPTVLEPGIIVTLEPTVTFTEGGDLNISIEDQFVITETGNECLTSNAPLDLYL